MVMVNLMCQLDWVIGYSNICPNIILGASVRVFWNEINIYINRSSKKWVLISLNLEVVFLLAFELELKHRFFLDLELTDTLNWNYTIHSLSS